LKAARERKRERERERYKQRESGREIEREFITTPTSLQTQKIKEEA